MIKSRVDNIRILAESITCLCAEGPEFMTKLELMDHIGKEALKIIKICDDVLKPPNQQVGDK